MRPRLSPFVLAAAVLSLGAPSAAEACQCGGTPPEVSGPTSASASGLLAVRAAGPRGPFVAYDLRDGRARFALPPGIASADGKHYVVSLRGRHATTLRLYDARAGRYLGARTVAGGWNLGAVSGNGRWIGLVRPARGATEIRLLDSRGGEAHAFTLHGWFDIDAVANDGGRVFLIQYVRAGYLIRFYDLRRQQLAARVLTEKGQPMAGIAWGAVASPDGRRLMTLYLRGDRAAEVHTLDLARGTAVCIDLPRGNAAALRSYTLALGPDRRTLYASNPELGVVATVDLRRLRVVHVARFRPHATGDPTARAAAVSHDGRTIYFAAGRSLYAYDAAYGRVRGRYDAGGVVAGLGFGPGDSTLRVVTRDGRSLRFDASTGARG
jgi:outer membrane protein assembly factor BamB